MVVGTLLVEGISMRAEKFFALKVLLFSLRVSRRLLF